MSGFPFCSPSLLFLLQMTACPRQMTGLNNTIADAFSQNGQGSVLRERDVAYYNFLNECLLADCLSKFISEE